jgi:hypothetical protein
MAHPTRIFKTPQELEFAWQSYKDHLKVEALEWVEISYVGKEATNEDAFKPPYNTEFYARKTHKDTDNPLVRRLSTT